jgi:two-component system, LuxR family, response regulator FixJ
MPAKDIRFSKASLIAIVDDDEAVREALSDLLLVLDVACCTFDRAEAFMAEFEPGRFDCLITDVRMPGRSGLELQERLRELGSSMPVIFITADTNPTTHARALRGGAYACLSKPVNDEELFHLLQDALNCAGRARRNNRWDTSSDD